ncbi:MAG: 7-cyano-7-deazaguanine synthase QueC [Candidatus Gracilibacteria bacterium]|nr:7-cyano-7-deazaguanine synthase QueC [Candidatus Gracilibacteria bacterium]
MTKALVLFSGGQDSTTCLAWALEKYDEVTALTFDYGQRHRVEILQSYKVAELAGVKHDVMKIDLFSKMSKNALTHDVEIDPGGNGNLPSTFVPGRNLLFLSLATIKAYQLGMSDVITGVCQTDYSGYPDCRDDFIQSLQKSCSLALDKEMTIHTPLMFMTKAETVEMINKHGKLDWLAESHTCYEGQRPACAKCPACLLRLKGFAEAGMKDPLPYL